MYCVMRRHPSIDVMILLLYFTFLPRDSRPCLCLADLLSGGSEALKRWSHHKY